MKLLADMGVSPRVVDWLRGDSHDCRLAPIRTNSVPMAKFQIPDHEDDELDSEYDLSQLKGEVRGKYFEQYRAGTNVVFLEPDVRAAFPTDEAVNQALRSLLPSGGAGK